MNHCEYFVFKSSRGLVEDPEDPEMKRRRRRPDWRNVHKGNTNKSKGGYDRMYSNGDSEDRARRARENLNRLFGGK